LSFLLFLSLLSLSFYCYNTFMSKHWKMKPLLPQEAAEKLKDYDALTAQLLYNRGVMDPEAAADFLNPDYKNLHDPFLFQDMQKAVERVWIAIENEEKVFIYGDYDADAVTANAVLQQAFRYLGMSVESYIPDRFTEGYGLNLEAFEKIKNAGATLVITVDCGTNSTDAADFCRANGIDLIITDHHEVIGDVPKAYALINPKNPADSYPYHEITGVGVAFKLACGILSQTEAVVAARENIGETHKEGWEKWLLDLVAIGTVADCHSLLGENRILVKFGLTVLQKSKWKGLSVLAHVAGLDFSKKPADTYTVGFVIAPRLNAAGRLEHASIALDVLLEQDPLKAEEKALRLNQINIRRQELTQQVMSEAREQVLQISHNKILLLTGENWPKGIVGLVAGKIAEEFNKPVIVLEKGIEESTGSARTVGEFNVVEALKAGSEHLIRFGGHKQAAGLTLKTANFDDFYSALLAYAEQNLKEADLEKNVDLEGELDENNLQLTTYNLLTKFEPFGVGNSRPKFLVPGMVVVSMRGVGDGEKHVQLQLQKGDVIVSGIAFNMGRLLQQYTAGDAVDVAAELTEDGWNGQSKLKLRVVDIRNYNADLQINN
jgi:single-stranded-DNA-specific exonuclease